MIGRASLPIYRCHRAVGPIRIDGQLDEPSWHIASPVPLVLAESGLPPRQATSVRLLWDDVYLYAAFECEDDDIWGITTERDQDIYNQEVVEIFIDDDADGRSYIEIEVSPLNAVLDLYMLWRDDRRKGLWDWDSEGLLTAVHVDGDPTRRGTADRRWTVEMAIPFCDCFTAPNLPPQIGDRWRINLYRIDRSVHGDEFTAWSPPGRLNFHTPSCFGILEFVE